MATSPQSERWGLARLASVPVKWQRLYARFALDGPRSEPVTQGRSTLALNLNSVMLGSQDSRRLADFYGKVLGEPNPEWSDDENGWFGWQAGDGGLAIGPHSEVKGRSTEPGRIMFNFLTSDVQGEFDRIKGVGAEVIAEPYEPGGGGMMLCTFADPDGNYFQLMSGGPQ